MNIIDINTSCAYCGDIFDKNTHILSICYSCSYRRYSQLPYKYELNVCNCIPTEDTSECEAHIKFLLIKATYNDRNYLFMIRGNLSCNTNKNSIIENLSDIGYENINFIQDKREILGEIFFGINFKVNKIENCLSDGLNDDISKLKDDNNNIKGNVDTIKDNVDTIKDDVDSIKDNVSNISDSVESMKDQCDNISQAQTNMEQQINDLTGEIKQIRGLIEDFIMMFKNFSD